MITSDFIGDIVTASLRQLGASEIKEVRNGILYIARFHLENGLELAYAFNITRDEQFFLQRTAPYPMSYGRFDNADAIVGFIKADIENFRNAQNSSNFQSFLETSETYRTAIVEWEQLFLTRNVSKEAMQRMKTSAEDLLGAIRKAYSECPEIELKK